MPFPNPATQFKPGISPNPEGRPKGALSWSTVIRRMVEDPEFEIKFTNGTTRKWPAWVITDIMIRKAASGDVAAAQWLIRSGYGDKIDITSGGQPIQFAAPTPRPQEIIEGEIVADDQHTGLPSESAPSEVPPVDSL